MRAGAALALAAATALALACAPAPAPVRAATPAGPTFRLLTYNVNYGIPGDAETVAAIRDANADLVLLQETNAGWERALRAAFATTLPEMRFRNRAAAGGMAVLSRLPLVEVEFLNPTGDGWFSAARIVVQAPFGRLQALSVHLRPPVSDGGSFVSGHFSTPAVRLDEITAHYGRLARGVPTLVAGDFNEEEDGRAVAFLLGKGMSSALARFAPDRPTWRWPWVFGTLHRQLDHVFYDARLDVVAAEVREAGNSDHLPVIAVVAALNLGERFSVDGAGGHRGHRTGHLDRVAVADGDVEDAARHLHRDPPLAQAQPVRDRRRRRAGGPRRARVARAALPDLDPDGVAIEDLHGLHVGAARKPRIALDERADAARELRRDVVERQHAVRVADGRRAVDVRLAPDDQAPADHLAGLADHRDRRRIEADPPHLHVDGPTARAHPAAHGAAFRRHRERLRPAEPQIEEAAREDPQPVAALLRLAAVGVEDPYPERARRVARRAPEDPVRAHPEVAVADPLHLRRRQLPPHRRGIDHQIVVPEPVILPKLHR
jgi:endonuclease/exonuclease/phosphatase (EEP) superfamily protein YafD